MRAASLRISRVASHLRQNCTSTSSTNWSILEIELGDTPLAWKQAGFIVSASNLVELSNCNVRLKATGSGLSRITFGHRNPSSLQRLDFNLPGIKAGVAAAASPTTTFKHHHPNSCTAFGEIVLYTQNLQQFVDEMTLTGINTHKNKPPKPMKQKDKNNHPEHACAVYYFGSDPDIIRMLVFGPINPTHDPGTNPTSMWMLGQGKNAETEVTGYLPLVTNMKSLEEHCLHVGPSKKAVQENRTIATLSAGQIHGLTGTFAFLSNHASVRGSALF